ncbi:MAG: hypothetical protein ACYDH9_17765 [Limisphaerales bacterium]
MNLNEGVNAPIFDVDGTTKLAGAGFLAQLYAAPPGDSLQPIGTPIPFISAGYFFGDTLTIPTVAPGASATAQVRAWRASDGGTFEAANHSGGHVGTSPVLNFVLGGLPPLGLATLWGMESFSLYVVPEPSVLALGLIGSLAFGLRRWLRHR